VKLLGRVSFAAVVLFCITASLTWAESDPPGRVARLQYIAGSVSIQPGGTDAWVAGAVNRPLTNSDNIWVDKDSRSELSVGTGVLRLDEETSVTLANISDSSVQVQLHQGTLNLRVRRLWGGEIYEVDTPNVAFTVQKAGEYRFDVGPSGEATLVTVWKGEGDATGDGPAVHVRSHERARFTNGTSLAHEIYEAPPYDGFDDWCRVRDRREDKSVAARYVSPGVIGYEDLDDYGTWQVAPTYGSVWVPAAVAPGWAPYRYGHWVWISPWGWTWVDDAPWGFAPFHYGRWIYTGYWAWVPGPVYVRPVYAPALVAWFGGSGFSVGVSFGGGYGWCPLGYGEPYLPWYGGSRGYFQRVNVTNTRIVNITNITNNYYNVKGRPVRPIEYANLRAPGAITAVPQHAILNSSPVAKNALPISAKEAREWGRAPLGRNFSLEPARESRLGVNAGKPSVAPPERVFTRPVIAKSGPGTSIRRIPEPPVAGTRNVLEGGPGLTPTRVIPRPPVITDGRSKVKGVPRPPVGGVAEARRAEPSPSRSVPRSADAVRPPDGNAVARPSMPQADNGAVSRSTLPAVRRVPRPPANPGNQSSSRMGPDEHPARVMPSAPQRSQGDTIVPRPSGPVAPAPPISHEQRAPRAESSASPRSMPEPPRSSAPTGARSVPRQAPAVHERAPAPARTPSAPGATPHSLKWR
jgi:hypothetical protein